MTTLILSTNFLTTFCLNVFILVYHLLFIFTYTREKGGAYGSGTIHKGGIFSFYSYRYCMPLLLSNNLYF